MNLMDITIGEYIKKTADIYPNKLAVVDVAKESSLTWQQLDQLSDDYAKGFLSIGLKKGDHLAIWSTNKAEWILCFLGASKVGIRTIMVNVNYKFEEVKKLLIESDAKGLVFMDGFRDADYIEIAYQLMEEQKNSMPLLEYFIHFGTRQCLGAIEVEDLINRDKQVTKEELEGFKKGLDPHDIINIQFTSGTTSAQKGVMLTHHNLVNNSYLCGERLKIDHKDKMCIAVSFFHCFGLSSGILMCIGSGTTMVLVESYRAIEVMKAVKRFNCTVLHGVPTMFRRILDHKEFKQDNFSSLRTGIIAGAACNERTIRDIDIKMNMKQAQIGYGQTESSPGCTQTFWDDPIEKKIRTIGKPLPHVEMIVKDINTGKACEVGVTGELCTRGYHVMKGYYKNEALTKEAIDEDGWLRTGDVGFVDDEGYYHICGRMKDIIIRGGENISPCEIEENLRQHSEIEDAQVYGIPEACYGEEIAASIQLKERSQLKEEEIRLFLSTRLAHYKIPKHMEFCTEYPLTPTGKVKKYILKENMIKNKLTH